MGFENLQKNICTNNWLDYITKNCLEEENPVDNN